MTQTVDLPDYCYLFLQQFDSADTRRQYRSFLLLTIKALGMRGRNLIEVTVDEFLELAEDLRLMKPDWSNSTWNSWVAAVQSFYDYLNRSGHVTVNPARLLRRRRNDEKVMPAPDAAEVKKMWELLLSPALWEKATEYQRKQLVRDRAIFALLVGCGLRVSTICKLCVCDLDVETRQIKGDVKGGHIKTFVWPEAATPFITPMLTGRDPYEPLFRNTNGDRIRDAAVRQMLEKLCAACNLPYYTPHAFRRYGATNLFQQGVNPDLIRRWGGWKKMDTAMRYNVDRNKPADVGQMP